MIKLTPPWGSPVEIERRNRIRVAVYAYAYEVKDECLIFDHEYDALALSIRPQMATGNLLLDMFFATKFSPYTGMWIYQHPEFKKIQLIYQKYYIS